METQEMYKKYKLSAFDYWKMELEYLTCSAWAKDDEFCNLLNIGYLLEKYPDHKIKLDYEDRCLLGKAFLIDLGMNPAVFPMKFA